MNESRALHMANVVSRLLDGTGERGVLTDSDIAKSNARAALPWEEQQKQTRVEVAKYTVGDRVRFLLGGPRGLVLYGTVDEIHELWIGVRGDDQRFYVCPPFSGIKKINGSHL